jgi:hypothetical protein
MALKLISKNNIGIISTLFLVMLLSQSRCFDFLTETPLGRLFLLAITIFICYTNKIFGLLAVIFIIIAFNVNDSNVVQSYNFYEGFKEGNKPEEKIEEANKTEETSKKAKTDMSETATTTSSSVSGNAREGFCMPDRELNILRGKQSNAIPVFNKSREQISEVDPTDKSAFSSDYAPF